MILTPNKDQRSQILVIDDISKMTVEMFMIKANADNIGTSESVLLVFELRIAVRDRVNEP